MFNKKLYWKNRKAGLRGQGEETPIKVHEKPVKDDHFQAPGHVVQVGKSFQLVNRKAARQMGQYGDNR